MALKFHSENVILQIFTTQKALGLHAATNIYERYLIEILKHLRTKIDYAKTFLKVSLQ